MTDKSQFSPDADATRFPGGVWALILGIGLLAGFLAVVVCSSIDRGNRRNLESSEQVTGVEDKVYFPIPAAIPPNAPAVVHLGEKSLFLAGAGTIGIHDSDVRRVGRDSVTGLAIYEATDLRALSSGEVGNTYLLKVETGRYAKVRVGK